MRSIIEHQTKPASEWIGGRVVQKVSPRERHARAQGRIAAALLAWADRSGCGRVGTEWEFRIGPPGEEVRTLVPDVAYLSYERLGYDEDDAAQAPYVAPNVAIEVISPDDRRRYVDEKICVYLASGAELVVLIDPQQHTAALHDAACVTNLGAQDIFIHSALPGFAIRIGDIFAKPKPRSP